MRALKFPRVEQLDVGPVRLKFRHAKGTDMQRWVKRSDFVYEPEVLALLLVLLAQQPSARFVNVGANIGYFPIIAKKLFGDRIDVHAYEPMPELLERLRRGCADNSVDIELSGAAVADFDGRAAFHLSARSDTSNSLNPEFRPSREVISVPVTTLDHESSAWDDRPTVLMVDTESTEPDVLAGGAGFIQAVRPAIICEVLAGRTEQRLGEFIDRVGYTAYAVDARGVHRCTEIAGDSTYQYRDWLFLPNGHEPPASDLVAATAQQFTGAA